MGKVDSEVQVHVKQEIMSQEISSPATDPSHGGELPPLPVSKGKEAVTLSFPRKIWGHFSGPLRSEKFLIQVSLRLLTLSEAVEQGESRLGARPADPGCLCCS